MKLTCPNNPEHKVFSVTAMVPEIWILNEDGDCEDGLEREDADCEDADCEDAA